jgi:hypothetical protein
MKILFLLLFSVNWIFAGTIVVIIPKNQNPGHFGTGLPIVESYKEEGYIRENKIETQQEGQVETYTYNDVTPGRYRISLMGEGNPMGYVEKLSETHIQVTKSSTNRVFLYPLQSPIPSLPEDVQLAIEQYQEKGEFELTMTFKGSDHRFIQSRGGGLEIHYLRPDCIYSLDIYTYQATDKNKNGFEIKTLYSKEFTLEKENPAKDQQDDPSSK